MAGMSIGRYLLEELISRGGMGEVWRARDQVLNRPVAVKLLYAEEDPAAGTRFLREAQAAARLVHPNVMAIYDVGRWDGRPYLVMELLDGPSVATELSDQGPLPVPRIRWIGAQAAAGLACAHAAGVIHRDVKPGNLVWTSDGTLKLVDFGLAWFASESSQRQRLTPDGIAMGTTAYLPPETAKGVRPDARSDLYALGCLLYELACGHPPFEGTLPTVIRAHLDQQPTPPSQLRRDLPSELEELILQLLMKNPEHRPAGAVDVQRRLTGAEPASGPDSEDGGTPANGRATTRRHAILATAVVAGAGLLASAVTWVWGSPEQVTGESAQTRPTTAATTTATKPSTDRPPPDRPTPRRIGGNQRLTPHPAVSSQASHPAADAPRTKGKRGKQPDSHDKDAKDGKKSTSGKNGRG
jgi:eukaryotic-like serine/threonine-protein kinase